MDDRKPMIVDSPVGKQAVDSTGSPLGVARMDVEQSYAGIGELLQKYINSSDQEAWEKIKAKTDYTYESLDPALAALERESGFGPEIKKRLEKGQKLFFKPNLVNPQSIDPQTHGPDLGSFACAEWPFVAALMRWFHDKLGVSYYQMALGEAATVMPASAGCYSLWNPDGETVTVEAVIEGKVGDFYCGWGFYFARKYLAERLAPKDSDDPMQGYEESVAGTYIPPGNVSDKLMVYDLNRIFDDTTKGRDLEVPGGINYQSIILHKALVGGDPNDSQDMKAYPGSILVNVPKLKVHVVTLLTNVIKNLGIGLYPMQSACTGGTKWDYSVPHVPVPGMKGGIPHEIWISEVDEETRLPKRGADGKIISKKTGGINATMIDIIKAVINQDIFMIHIVDAIEGINMDHQGIDVGTKEPEGMVFAGLDPVATDLLSARYMFSNVPLAEALEAGLEDGHGGRFPQAVPVPTVEGTNIISQKGYDCPISRDESFEDARKRGLGETSYYAVGRDAVTDSPIVSFQGHLGTINNGEFSDVITKTLYFDVFKMPWDMQHTTFTYMEVVDKLTGSSLKREFMETFDERGDGIINYNDSGKNGIWTPMMYFGADFINKIATEKWGHVGGWFSLYSKMMKCTDASWNRHEHDFLKEYFYGPVCVVAYQMSIFEMEMPDFFIPDLMWGNGKWPSFQMARFIYMGLTLYGEEFPNRITPPSMYSAAFRYADVTQNQGRYTGGLRNEPEPESIDNYIADVSNGKGNHLDFIVYIPEGYDFVAGSSVPNVEVSSNPEKILTASFAGGKEVWPKKGF